MQLDKHNLIRFFSILNVLSLLFLITQMPFYFSKVQQVAIVLFFGTYLIDFALTKRWKSFQWNKSQWVFILFIAYFLLLIIYAPFESDSQYLQKIIDIRLPFLLVGIIGLFGVNQYFRLRYIAYTLLLTSVAIIFYLVFLKVGIQNFIQDSSTLKFARMEFINSHMIFNYFLNLSLIFMFYLLLAERSVRYHIIVKSLFVLSGLIIYVILLFSEGRVGFLIANIIVFAFLFYSFWKINKIISIFVGMALLLGLAIIVAKHERIDFRNISKEPRVAVWKLAIGEYKEYPIFGQGASTGAGSFMDKLEQNKHNLNISESDPLTIGLEKRLILCAHAHSQFLMSMIEFGIFGLIIFVALNFFPLFVIPRGFCIYIFMFVLISVSQLFTDIFQSGVSPITYCLFMLIFFRSDESESSKIQQS